MYNGEDRVRQVNEIDAIAQSLTSSHITVADYDGDAEAFARDVVNDWLGEAKLPAWWDGHDTFLLLDRVRESAS